MTEPTILLDVHDVHAAYSQTIRALSGVSLTVRKGEILAVLSSNGAGKTTTLRAISNLLPAERGQGTSGTITFEGRDVLTRKPADLVRSGLVQVLEGRHCFKSLDVEENLFSGGLGRSSSRADIAEDLELVYATFPRLREKRSTAAGLISGGEQQMTAIGRALMSRRGFSCSTSLRFPCAQAPQSRERPVDPRRRAEFHHRPAICRFRHGGRERQDGAVRYRHSAQRPRRHQSLLSRRERQCFHRRANLHANPSVA
jgi:ABC-type lipoprotein export system ATPase subunit